VARYIVRSISPGSLVVPGAVAGALLAAVPGLLLAYAAVTAVHAAHTTLETWRTVRLPLPPPLPSPTADMVDLLHLTAWLATLRAWDASPPLLFVALAGASLLLGAAAGALGGLLAVLILNAGAASGGLAFDLTPAPDPSSR
jgi:hypothetical protein